MFSYHTTLGNVEVFFMMPQLTDGDLVEIAPRIPFDIRPQHNLMSFLSASLLASEPVLHLCGPAFRFLV